MRTLCIASAVAVLACAAGCCPSRSPQTGAPVGFSGTIAPRGCAVHDFDPPPRTTQSNLDLSWNAGNLRLSELVPTCPAGQEDQCVRLTDPIEAQAPAQRSIHTVATNQRPENREQMKFLIENLSGEAAAYTLTIVPRSAGCT